ncbi:MAG: hypothetical protein HKN43_02605 [Rhodothermales bacterium]|nr:hypothetical protein [Rhodothermales bacterium]
MSQLSISLVVFVLVSVSLVDADPKVHKLDLNSSQQVVDTTSFVQIADNDEPGVRLEVYGTVYKSDGVTPAAGIQVHVYHTDATGKYGREGDPQGTTRLNGDMVTGESGEYRFTTIKPASYPGTTAPAHIHYRITVPGKEGVTWFALEFADDAHISESKRKKEKEKGRFSSIIELTENGDGLTGTFNLKLDG